MGCEVRDSWPVDSTALRFTVRVWQEGANGRVDACASDLDQGPTEKGSFYPYAFACPAVECTEENRPIVNNIRPSCDGIDANGAIQIAVSVDPRYAGAAKASCAFYPLSNLASCGRACNQPAYFRGSNLNTLFCQVICPMMGPTM